MDRQQHRIHTQIRPPALEADPFYRPCSTVSDRKLAGNFLELHHGWGNIVWELASLFYEVLNFLGQSPENEPP